MENSSKSPYNEPRAELITQALNRIGKCTEDIPMNPEELMQMCMLLIKGTIDQCHSREMPYPARLSMPTDAGDWIVMQIVDRKTVAKAEQQQKLKNLNIVMPN